jgi:putative transcriptional regulator
VLNCHGVLRERVNMFHYKSCGLDNIWLKNGFDKRQTNEGSGYSIHDIDNLHRVIAKGIIEKPAPISGKEFRFLRIEMEFSQKAIGDLMDKTDQMIAKWEKGENNVPVLADAAIRNIYRDSIGMSESSIAKLLKELKDLDRQLHEIKIEMEETSDGWSYSACA